MKTTIVMIAMIAAACLVAGCRQDVTPVQEQRTYANSEITTCKHDGHLFVVWDSYNAGGIMHHPACPCHAIEAK